MNNINEKLIREIAFDCYSTRDGDFNTVKFAELIIQECINIASEHRSMRCLNDDETIKRIKEHFGIESND